MNHNFAMLCTRDPELFSPDLGARELLLRSINGKPALNTTPQQNNPYSITMYARKGVHGSDVDSIRGVSGQEVSALPYGLYGFVPIKPGVTPWRGWDGQLLPGTQVSAMSGITGHSLVVRLVPAPQISVSNRSETEIQKGILTPRGYAAARMSSNKDITIDEWEVDTVFSADAMTEEWQEKLEYKPWLEGYLSILESLSQTHPILGRKPYLGFRYGSMWYGIGRTALILEEFSYQPANHYHHDLMQGARVRMRLSEVMLF